MVAPAQPAIEVKTPADEQTVLEPPYKVLLHNDDVTPYDFVIRMLRAVFHLPGPDAEAVTWEAHSSGIAYVMTLALEEAKHRVGQAHSMARGAGYPLTLTIEPDE